MKNYKLKMEIIDENNNSVGTATITCKTIQNMIELHNISTIDETYNQLLQEISSKIK